MRISVMDVYGRLFSFDMDGDTKIEGLKLTIEVEMNVSSSTLSLMHEGKLLLNFQTLD
jgi:DNA damage-inducible protein 1